MGARQTARRERSTMARRLGPWIAVPALLVLLLVATYAFPMPSHTGPVNRSGMISQLDADRQALARQIDQGRFDRECGSFPCGDLVPRLP